MRKLFFILLFIVSSSLAFGTAQIPDILIYKGDTISLFDCPLAYLANQELFRPQNLFGSSGCFYTACYRNYVATWIIDNNKLYLISIRNACYPTKMSYVAVYNKDGATTLGSEYADLKTLFPDRYENGRVLADWVNKKMISPKGKMLFYVHDGFESVFEREIEFTIEKGILIEVKELDNSKTHQSKYTKNPELILEFIQSNINYSNLKKTDSTIRVIVLVNGANDEGKIDNVRILKGYNEAYNREAERVVKSIPEWDVVYRHGERSRGYSWSIPVVFDWK
jgi:hypothetical protein